MAKVIDIELLKRNARPGRFLTLKDNINIFLVSYSEIDAYFILIFRVKLFIVFPKNMKQIK